MYLTLGLFIHLLHIHCILCYSIDLGPDIQGFNGTGNGNSSLVDDDPLIPPTFRVSIQGISFAMASKADALTIMTDAVGLLGVLQYDADMSLRDFSWPKENPRATLRFTARPGMNLEVRHQMWALTLCAYHISSRPQRDVPGFVCSFKLDPAASDLGSFVMAPVAAQSPLKSNTTVQPLGISSSSSQIDSSDVPALPLASGQTTNLSQVSEDSSNELPFKIRKSSNRPLDISELCNSAIEVMLGFSVRSFRRKPVTGLRIGYGLIITEISIDSSAPAPRGYQPNWHDFIRLLRAAVTYMSETNMLFESYFGIYFAEDHPFVRGSFQKANAVANIS